MNYLADTRRMIKNHLIFLSFLSILLSACDDKETSIAVTSVAIDKSSIELTEGEKVQLKASIFPTNATDAVLLWKSDNTDVAFVNEGLVLGVKAGTARVYASAGGKTSYCNITVTPKIIQAESIELDISHLDLIVDDNFQLKATLKPDNTSDKTTLWSTSDNNIVTVSSSGVVTAKGIGTAIITVRNTDGSKTASCTVSVKAKEIPVTSIILSNSSLSMIEGETSTLQATISPSNSTNQEVSWLSSDPSVATISSTGVITAIIAGTTTITCMTPDGTIKESCEVTVSSGISIDKSSITIEIGQSETIRLSIGGNKWTFSDLKLHLEADSDYNDGLEVSLQAEKVDDHTRDFIIIGKCPGAGVINIESEDGRILASCHITVNAATIAVTSVTLDKTSLSIITGSTGILTASVSPSNATNKDVIWSSSNTSIATVNSNGIVSGKSIGTATITCMTQDGSFKATCTVTVQNKDNPDQSAEEAVMIYGPNDDNYLLCKGLCYYISSTDSYSVYLAGPNDACPAEVVIPNYIKYKNRLLKVVTIGKSAFKGQSTLKKLTIPSTVSIIGIAAFKGCTGLKELIFEDSKEEIDLSYQEYQEYVTSRGPGKGQFYDCPLEFLYLGRNVKYSEQVDISPQTGLSPFYKQAKLKTFICSNNVTRIGKNFLYGCESLSKLVLSDSIISIGQEAFTTCKVEEIILPPKLTLMEHSVLSGSDVKRVSIPASLKKLPENAFGGCKNLQEVHIYGLDTIVSGAFDGCNKISNIYCYTSKPPIFSRGNSNVISTFSSMVFTEATLYVPEESIDLYKEANGWKNFWTIKALQ